MLNFKFKIRYKNYLEQASKTPNFLKLMDKYHIPQKYKQVLINFLTYLRKHFAHFWLLAL